MKHKVSLDTVLVAADILRGMYDDEEETNKCLTERIHPPEMVLMENHIAIPGYGIWHGEFPMV